MPSPVPTQGVVYPSESGRVMSVIIRLGEILEKRLEESLETVDLSLAKYSAIKAILASLIGIVLYIWVRFQQVVWGLAAVLALVHDVLMMLGAIAISKWLDPTLSFLMVDTMLSLTFLHWDLESPNYFGSVDKRVWLLNWAPPAKARNTAGLVLALCLHAPGAGGVLVILVLLMKLWSIGRVRHLLLAEPWGAACLAAAPEPGA